MRKGDILKLRLDALIAAGVLKERFTDHEGELVNSLKIGGSCWTRTNDQGIMSPGPNLYEASDSVQDSLQLALNIVAGYACVRSCDGLPPRICF